MTKVSYTTSAKSEWNGRTAGIKASAVDDVEFAELFKAYLPRSKRMTCIEIGSIPGTFLVYFHKTFGYKITGIDFADNTDVFHENMHKNSIDAYDFIKGDFFKYRFTKQYDVVSSFGFIEHFDDRFDVLKRHADLVKPGGFLVLTLPNFRFLQHLYHYYFDKPNLDIHNLRMMNLGYLKRSMKQLGMDKLYASYYGNLRAWREETELSPRRFNQFKNLHLWIGKYGKKFPTSRLYSPYIVLIYQKPAQKKVRGA